MTAIPKPHLYQSLTREEFQTCWALRMTLGFEDFDDAYPLDAYASPNHEGEAQTYEEQVKRAIRFLALDHGFEFAGLQVFEDGQLRGAMTEPRNGAYVASIALYVRSGGALGAMPNPIHAAKVAMQILEDRCPRVSLEPLRQLVRELDAAVDQMPDPDPEAEAEYARDVNEALAAVGALERETIH